MSEVASNVINSAAIFTDPRRYLDLTIWHRDATLLRRYDPTGVRHFYAITRYADVVEIERQPRIFLNTTKPILSSLANQQEIRAGRGTLKTLVHMDGYQHES
jgi:hypothetical protein